MPEKLRIAVWYNLPSGGGKRALNDHLRGLKARGHGIVAFRPPIPQADYLPVADIVEEREIPLEKSAVSERTIVDRTKRAWTLAQADRDAMRRHSEAAAKEIDEGGFDVLFANTCLRYHAPWIGRYARAPHLLYLQEPFRTLYEASLGTPWPLATAAPPTGLKPRLRHLNQSFANELKVRAFRQQTADEIENARHYDRILVNSNFSRESILRAYGLDADVCYLGIDAERFEDRGLAREPFAISVGAFQISKDPEFIVRSIATIPSSRPPLVWVANMVDAAYRTQVESLARDLGVDLEIRQYVPDSELQDLLNRASVFAYAPRLEPFGYAPLEANACGLPAVVVAEGGVKETVVDGLNGLVVPHRPEAMGAAIAGLLADPARARAMGERAAAHVREAWSLERATDELERNLIEVAGHEHA